MNVVDRAVITVCVSAVIGGLIVAVVSAVIFAQKAEPADESAEKVRQLIKRFEQTTGKDQKVEEKLVIAMPGLREIFKRPDPQAALALLNACPKLEDLEADPSKRYAAPLVLIRILFDYMPFEYGNFMVSLLPLMDSDPQMANDYVNLVVNYYCDTGDRRIRDWVATYLKKDQLPPGRFLDKLFERSPGEASIMLEEIHYTPNRATDPAREFLKDATFHSIRKAIEASSLLRQIKADGLEGNIRDRAFIAEVKTWCESDKKQARALLVRAWASFQEWYERRRLLHYVREYPNIFLTPELMKLMRQEKHPAIKPLVEELEEIYARFFPSG
jgi:hypothetical protein